MGDGTILTDKDPVHAYAAPGSYTTSLILFGNTGCTDTFSVQQPVKIYTKPTFTIVGPMEKCAETTLGYTGNIQSEDAITQYAWQLNNHPIGNSNNVNHYFATAGAYTLAFTVRTQYGCTETVDTTVTIRPLPVPAASPRDTTVCIGSSVPLHARDGNQYTWWPQTNLQNAQAPDPVATALADTRYYVRVINTFGCEQKDSVRIRVDEKVNLRHSDPAVICRGERTRLYASGNTRQFEWTPATGLSDRLLASPWASPDQTTTYQVTGFSRNTCPHETDTVTITVGNIPTVDLGPDLSVDAGRPIDLKPVTSPDVVKYQWQPATGLSCTTCPTPRLIADKDASYRLTVRTQYNCEFFDDIRIAVTCGKGAVYIPNAFTPNGDGNNDIFYIKGYGIQKIKSLRIFNRWGQIVYSRDNILPNDKNAGWDGKVKGQVPASDAFVYIVEVVCNENKLLPLKGTLMLIK